MYLFFIRIYVIILACILAHSHRDVSSLGGGGGGGGGGWYFWRDLCSVIVYQYFRNYIVVKLKKKDVYLVCYVFLVERVKQINQCVKFLCFPLQTLRISTQSGLQNLTGQNTLRQKSDKNVSLHPHPQRNRGYNCFYTKDVGFFLWSFV